MRILLTGASGLIGSALSDSLSHSGHQLVRLRRTPDNDPGAGVSWNPETGRVTLTPVDPPDAVIHLAAENIGKRWTSKTRLRIWESRVTGTRNLCTAIASLPQRPKVLLSASAVGIYGDRGDEWVDEQSPPGRGFLADLCRNWEASTRSVSDLGIRVVHLRFGMVLSPRGGAIGRMLPLFKCGLGGPLGSGDQFWSWIGIADVVGAIGHLLAHAAARGAVNLVSPNPVTNLEFTRTLGAILDRPTMLRVPRALVEGILGEMGREVLLASARVRPTKLLEAGYSFQSSDLESALRAAVDSPKS